MARGAASHKQTILEVSYLGLSMLGSWLILRWALKQMDPNRSAKHMAKERRKELARRLGRDIKLDGAYEDVVAQAVCNPKAIDVKLNDVGGLDHIIEDVTRNVITPMRFPSLYKSSLLRQKRGVLLYGPPGTGKTMLAKALAKECDACFILLKSSTILSKWYGDSSKLVAAVWSLANKLQPCILFIDEVDSLLGQRNHQEHEATTAIKTEFMQLWEGFETTPGSNILVLGATNKKEALDDAVLRRFSLQYEVQLPNAEQREAILRLTLARHAKEIGPGYLDPELLPDPPQPAGTQQLAIGDGSAGGSGGGGAPADGAAGSGSNSGALVASSSGSGGGGAPTLRWLAQQTDGFSGSDLVQLCSQAAAVPIQDLIDGEPQDLRPLSRADFEKVFAQFTPPSRAAQEVRRRTAAAGGAGGNGSAASATDMQLTMLVEALRQVLGPDGR
ncbi:ATPase family AAA domain-containing 1-like [Micractinium conductrix]|uniref:ATPase family AAA domain-containing 1-like n=1 Tax=Micractinium conductrix TaxID=554055 RepID=A0A2P6VRI0_9CHLO|nr:ATPase family AAA domain-containing 1-like [Micractinium conductrix]|eukprot:PSC76681.1 ATPase family AAA domain-containing 1-like [Micractinium conductrix]